MLLHPSSQDPDRQRPRAAAPERGSVDPEPRLYLDDDVMPGQHATPSRPAPRGCAAAHNPGNRFESLHLEPDLLEPDDEAFREREPTQFLVDASKSILAENDSPDVGFRFSLNPYRGCEHGCVYCLDGDTPILMADGTTRSLADIAPGDEIYGTRRQGHCRRYRRTRVLAHWATRKPAFRITLQDGTELIASGDHRFLTLRGWKYVTGTQQGPTRRPHLTHNDHLLGVGRLTRTTPRQRDAYRRGYLCGVIRGDGHISSYAYCGRRRTGDVQHHFRLALADAPALDRAELYLHEAGVATHRFEFQKATTQRRRMQAIRSHAQAQVESIRRVIDWPARPCSEWQRGFLAGIFDAAGHHCAGILRISNTDVAIIDQTSRALRDLGFDPVVETPGNDRRKPLHTVRVRGGLAQHLRFLHEIDPAILRKRNIEDRAVKSGTPLQVVSVEPLGPRNLFDITTGTGDFIADGAVSHNCYARPTHEYLGFSAGLDFETRILVKERAPDLLRETFRKKSWQPRVVALSGNTDCYQPVERRLQLTRRCLEVFLEFRNPVTIITKNALVTRDLDLLAELAALDLVHVTLSITSLRRPLTAMMEPRTSRPEKRLEAIARLRAAGVPAGVNVAPLIPGLNDEEVPAILEAAAARDAQWAHYIMVRLPGAVEPLFLDWLQRTMPDRAGRIISRLRAVRHGRLSDPRFGTRGRGEGELADVIASFFQLSRRRCRLDGAVADLSTQHFRRSGHHQLQLFDP